MPTSTTLNVRNWKKTCRLWAMGSMKKMALVYDGLPFQIGNMLLNTSLLKDSRASANTAIMHFGDYAHSVKGIWLVVQCWLCPLNHEFQWIPSPTGRVQLYPPLLHPVVSKTVWHPNRPFRTCRRGGTGLDVTHGIVQALTERMAGCCCCWRSQPGDGWILKMVFQHGHGRVVPISLTGTVKPPWVWLPQVMLS